MTGSYTLRDLIAAASSAERLTLSERAVRQYVAEGLLPPPRGQGLTAMYSAEHLAYLRLVLRLVGQYVPLPEIRRWMQGLTSAQIEALLERPAVPRLPVEGDAHAYLQRLLRSLPSRITASSAPDASGNTSRRPALRQMLRSPLGQPRPQAPAPIPAERWLRVVISQDIVLMVRDSGTPAMDQATRLAIVLNQALSGDGPAAGDADAPGFSGKGNP